MIDGNGNIIPVNAIRGEKGKDGVNGKSAYEQAKEGGYDGTEEEFIALLNGLTNTDTGNSAHYTDFGNPHRVTAEQVGALPITGGQLQGGLGFIGEGDANTSEIVQNSDFATIFRNKAGGIETILSLTNESKVDVADVLKLWFANGNGYSIYGEHNKPTASEVGAIPEGYYASDDLNNELQQGGSKMKVCSYHSGTLNTPYKEGLTVFAHGMVITNAYDVNYGTQLCMPSGEDAIYVRRLNGSGISQWVKLADNDRITPIEKGGTGATTKEEALSKLGGLPLTGGVLTGDITLVGDPTDDMHPATKKYADSLKGAKFTLLWENASPASGFSAQTITLSSGDYDFLFIEYQSKVDTAYYRASVMVHKPSTADYKEKISLTLVHSNGQDAKLSGRYICYHSTYKDYKKLYVEEGYYTLLYKTSSHTHSFTESTSECYPIKIYGVKL